MKINRINWAVLLFLPLWATAQQQDPSMDPPALERLLLDGGEGVPEWVEENGSGKLPLNQAEAAELAATGLCDELQALALLEYRRAFGPLRSVYELRHVPLWDSATIHRALPHIRLEEPSPFRPLHHRLRFARGELLARWTRRWGEEDPLPSPDRFLMRWRLRHRDDLSLGIVLDKDPGEPWWSGPPLAGPDYVSVHAYVRRPFARCRAVALGDYEIRLGQGLAIWQGGGFFSTGPADRRRWAEALRPHTGALESGFFRGAAAQFEWGKKWEGLLFFSRRRRDASVDKNGTVTALRESGYHRTVSERAGQRALGETAAGAAVQWRGAVANVRAYGLWTRFDRPVEPDSAEIYRRFQFRGQTEGLLGADAVVSLRGARLYAEAAKNLSGGWAALVGASAKAGDAVRLSATVRHFSQEFTALHGRPSSRSGRSEAETGLELAADIRPGPRWRATLLADLYRFPWPRYASRSPSLGCDWSAQVFYQPAKNLTMAVQVRHNRTERDGAEAGTTAVLGRLGIGARVEAELSPGLEWRMRAEFMRASGETASPMGIWLGQDVGLAKKGWGFQARLAVFHVEDYDARIYVYENQVRFAFSAPAFQGDGLRWYLNARADLGENGTLWARAAQTLPREGAAPVELSLQLQWEF